MRPASTLRGRGARVDLCTAGWANVSRSRLIDLDCERARARASLGRIAGLMRLERSILDGRRILFWPLKGLIMILSWGEVGAWTFRILGDSGDGDEFSSAGRSGLVCM